MQSKRSSSQFATTSTSGIRWEFWLQEARDGSRDAQAHLLQALRPYLLAVAHDELASELRPKLAASDVVQNAMWRASQGFGDFRGQTRAELVNWLRTILYRCVADEAQPYRATGKRDLRREQSLDEMAGGGIPADRAMSPSGELVAAEQRHQIERAVRRLSPRQEQAVRLRSELELSFSEMGVALNCTANAARKLWLAAVRKLARELRSDEYQ